MAEESNITIEDLEIPESGDSERRTIEVREEIESTRAHIGGTIDAIQEKLSVANLTSNLKHEVSEQIDNSI